MCQFIRSVFFGNYFIGIIAIALSIESCTQLRLPLNSAAYYTILFCITVFYYTYAYLGPLNAGNTTNPRKDWYNRNHRFVLRSQVFLLITAIASGICFLYKNFTAIQSLPFVYWLLAGIVALSGILYYELLPGSVLKINLRNTGWLKAFVIGFVWACVANILPFIVAQIETGPHQVETSFLIWLFIKNFMFCTVNAIIFDIKDYADDSNRQLKTFVVRFGLRRTIFYILLPLTIIGLFSLVAFTMSHHFSLATILINLIPFILLFMIAWSMQWPHKILYYLVIIDGLIFFKAVCGIVGMNFINN
ncbi:UbiA family prenyltransferase [Parafilimonas sp.]|uniref:UbiA family prenyltransferase n=1 Tax=Parafilimonas sp. TaxID=1969739 RepID=UPI0039E22C6D